MQLRVIVGQSDSQPEWLSVWSSPSLLRPDNQLDLEIDAFVAGRTPAPGDVSKMNVSVAGNGVDEADEYARLVVGYGIALREPGFSQTSQQLLQDGLISPLVFELLERQGVKMPEPRYAVIQGACRASQLPAIDCGESRR